MNTWGGSSLKVRKRGGFSDRNGIKPENCEIQLKEFDDKTRIKLQNMINKMYNQVYKNSSYYEIPNQEFYRFVLDNVYAEPIDVGTVYYKDTIFNIINGTIINDDYDDVLTLIEAVIQYWDSYLKKTYDYQYYDNASKKYRSQSLFDKANKVFETEYIGYRFVDGIIVPISDSYEIGAINEALNSKYDSVYGHITKANKNLADREKPDYENSIKESISAVEAMCEIITGMKGRDATLGNMLKHLEDKGIVIHSGLKAAFSTLYGYTSDANGIRHAGEIGGPQSTFEEAKFMLVACCAFINYLTSLYSD